MVVGYIAAAERIELEIGKPEGPVLDIGCNTGAGMLTLSKRWPQTVSWGVEPVDKFAIVARERGLRVRTARAEGLPFPANFFSFIFSRHSLEHVADRGMAISEMLRVLHAGGHAYIQAPLEPGGSKNKLHLSPFENVAELTDSFNPTDWKHVYLGPQETVAELIVRKL